MAEPAAPLVAVSHAPMPQQYWRDRLAHPFCLACAAAAHLALLALILPASTEPLGETGTSLEAIAVDVVDALPVAYVPAIVAPEVATQPPSTDEALHEPLPEAAAPLEPEQHKPPQKSEPALPLPLEPEPPAEAIALLPDPIERTPVPPREEPPPEKPPEPIVEAKPQPPAPPPQAEVMPTIATAQASSGEIAAYAREVSRILARNPPRGSRGYKGRVHIQFVIGPAGRTEAVRVSTSSGHPKLDDAVVRAVAGLSFPVPPAGMSERDRTMVLPFIFR